MNESPSPITRSRTVRGSWRATIAVLLAVAIASRARSFGNPIVQVDEEFYLQMARAMWRGAIPYVDIWDRKPVGLFVLYLPAALFTPRVGVYIYHALALASVIGTAALVRWMARAVGWRRGALVAAALYILWLDLADGQGGQSPVFYNLLMAGAIALVLGGGQARLRPRGMAAMMLVGLALQIKYSVVFEGIWIGLWLMWAEHRLTRSIPRAIGHGTVLCLIALAPTLAVIGVYAAMGRFDAFVYANFLSIFSRHPDPTAEQWNNATVAFALLGPLVALACAGIGMTRATGVERAARAFLYGWLAVALFGFIVFGGWYNHYTLPVMLPGCLCVASFFGDCRIGRWLAWPTILAAFVAGQVVIAHSVHNRGTRAEFRAVVEAIGREHGSLYVDDGDPALFTFTDRHALTPYLFPSHLQYEREAGAIGVDQAREIDRIFAQKPDVVVLHWPDAGEDPRRAAQVRALIARYRYGPPVQLPLGRFRTDVYHLRTVPRSPAGR